MAVSYETLDQPFSGSLKRALRRSERWRRFRALGLAAPLLLFIAVTFLFPIGVLLRNAVYSPELADNLPRTVAALKHWDGRGVPGDQAFAALAADLKEAAENRTLALIGKRLNYADPGMRSLIMDTGRAAAEMRDGSRKETFLARDPRWGERETWARIAQAAGPYTPYFLLAALDLKQDVNGDIVQVSSDQAIFIDILARTLWISALVTVLCLVLGYPVAYLLASVPPRLANRLMFFVLLPFWTSLLVRIVAWIVLLQREGVVNSVLRFLGAIDRPLDLVYNLTGVLIAMTHILLPFMILPIYSVMKGISPSYMRAAASLGANPLIAFIRVYLPQTIPGLGAGCLLVFILAVGYYIAPALVGGPHDQMVSYFIAQYTNVSINWGMASALGAILLVIVMLLYLVYNRLVGIDRMRLG
ncbi:MAG TPA: ABC transporter permease [Alphaproteobacteria bacterium]|nr:ABC transporter permease [Alphaproteobacteria bacterium]